MERQVLHVDMDAFFVSVERIARPHLRGRPLIVGGPPAGRGVVACASYEAREAGVRSAMPVGLALSLCPDALLVPPDFDLYGRASRAVFDVLGAYSPVVEPASIDEAYLDLTGTRRLLGPPRDTALAASRELRRRLGLEATAGVASSRLVAKVASSLAKPSGVMDVRQGYEAGILAPLPVRMLPSVGPRTQERLALMGVGTIGRLAAIPAAYLAAAFGARAGPLLHDRARGVDPSAVTPRRKNLTLSAEETFPVDTGDPAALAAILFGHVERLCGEMRRRGERASAVTVTVRFADFVDAGRGARLDAESDLELEVFPVAAGLLALLLGRRILVRKVGVRFSRLSSACWQLPLFDREGRARGFRLVSAIDALRRRYGRGVVEWGRVVSSTTTSTSTLAEGAG